jgi:hypothetical protein
MFGLRLTVAAAFAFVTLAPFARAADEPTIVRGSIEQVDAAAGRVTVRTGDGKTLTLQITKGTTVDVDGHTAKPTDLMTGQRVRVTYRVTDGRNEVVTLTGRKTTGQDVAREAREALEAAGRYTYQQKEQYAKRLRQVVEDLDDQIADLEQRTQKATADAKIKLDRQLKELKQKRAVVNERLEKVKAAGADAWDDLKSGIRSAIEDLQRALDGDK